MRLKTTIDIGPLMTIRKENIVLSLFLLGILIAIFGNMQVWFMWRLIGIYPIFAAFPIILALLIDHQNQFGIFTHKETIVLLSLFVLASVMTRIVNLNNINSYITLMFDVIVLYGILRINRVYLIRIMTMFCKILAIMLATSIVMWMAHLCGVPLPNSSISSDTLLYSYTNYYSFLIDDRSEFEIIPRFHAFFLEPGHLGTLTAFLLLVQVGNWKQWYNIILWVATILSFSLAAYVLMVIIVFAGAWLRGKRILPSIITITSVLALLVIASFFYNNGDNLLNNLIVQRLEVSDDGKMEGDNRVTGSFEAEYEDFITSPDILFGREYSGEIFGFGNSGYRVFFYDNGIIVFLIIAVFYLAIAHYSPRRPVAIVMLIIATAAFYVRGRPLEYNFMIPLYAFSVIGLIRPRETQNEDGPTEEEPSVESDNKALA